MGWLGYQLTHSRFLLGLIFTLNTLPPLFLSAYAGSLADRLPRLAIFKATTWFAMVSSLLVAGLDFAGWLNFPLLVFFSILWGAALALEMPARQSLIMGLVGPKDLVNALSLNSAMVNIARVAGPSLGAFFMAKMGTAWCFLFDGLSFLAVAYALTRIKLPRFKTPPDSRKNRIREVLRYITQRPSLARPLALVLVMSIGAWDYGWVLAMAGLGSCLAALLVATKGRSWIRESLLYTGIGIFSGLIFIFGFQEKVVPAALILLGASFGFTLFFSPTNSLLQIQTPNEMRGRVMGLWATLFGGGMPLGSFWMGWAADRFGSGRALQAGGIFCVAGSLLVLLIFRKNNNLPRPFLSSVALAKPDEGALREPQGKRAG
jgi:MFS family permease